MHSFFFFSSHGDLMALKRKSHSSDAKLSPDKKM